MIAMLCVSIAPLHLWSPVMSIKIFVIAIVMSLPASVAMACQQHNQQTQSCAVGTVWDDEAQQCTKQVTG